MEQTMNGVVEFFKGVTALRKGSECNVLDGSKFQ